jgi:fructokinase
LVDCFGDRRIPGGALANVACHIAALGENAVLVSRVGDDAEGRKLSAWLSERGVSADLLQIDPVNPTGVVRVLPGPRYDIEDRAAWDFIEIAATNRATAGQSRIVAFGTLAQRTPASRKTIRNLVTMARSAGVPALCDLNLRSPFYDEATVLWSLRNCDVLKLNREELETVSRLIQARGETGELFAGLLREFSIPRGVLTDGAEGAWFSEEGETWHQSAEQPEVFSDAVGAGDAFCAVLSVALARGISLRQTGPAAASLAAYVVSQPGATPEIPRRLADRVNEMLAS